MPLLNQIIAVENGEKKRCEQRTTEIHHLLQKNDLLSGISRRYVPKDDADLDLPSGQETHVQQRVRDALKESRVAWTRYFDITATKDAANMQATADVVVDDEVILKAVPVVTLLFLEKQLRDEVKHLLGKLPILDGGERWSWNASQDCWASAERETARTKKIPRVLVKVEPTKEHPAQTEVWQEDRIVGTWHQVLYSGAAQRQDVQAMLDRAEKLLQAVQCAREKANMIEAKPTEIGDKIFDYVFGK